MKKVYLLAIAILTLLSCKERIKMEKIANLYKEVKYFYLRIITNSSLPWGKYNKIGYGAAP